MSLLHRNYLGLKITEKALHGAVLKRERKKCLLEGARSFSLRPEVLRLSLREPNVAQPKEFVEGIAEVLDPLAGREDRVALSLPDSCGRVILTELESAFKNKAEGRDILRWQLKKNLPSELGDIHLDFQVFSRDDSGRQKVLAALMDKAVLEQYEELVADAGYHATSINFHSFDLYSYYRSRFEMGEDSIFIGVEGKSLSIEIFQEGLLAFHRVRETAENPDRVFQELSRSLVGYQASHPGLRKSAVCLHSDWSDSEPLKQALTSLFDKAPIFLNPHMERMTEGGNDTLRNLELISAIGAAERMM